MQSDFVNHTFKPGSYFEAVLDRYTFDRKLRLILFDAIERIEIALRTKMIYFLSQSYGGLWHLNTTIVDNVQMHTDLLTDLQKEFKRSNEIFIKDHKHRYPHLEPDTWKIMEVASMGTLSKIYKNLHHQLPEKAKIANEMGLRLHSELSSWLEAIVYVRNIIAHHSRLWNRNMVKTPRHLINPASLWLRQNPTGVQMKKPFYIITAMLYLCNKVTPNHQIKHKIIELIGENPNIPVYKVGFINNWQTEPIWQ